MQTDHSSGIAAAEVSSISLEFPSSKIQKILEENEQKYRTDLMKAENNYLQNLYDEQRKSLDELMQCENLKEQKNFLQKEFTTLNDYIENLRQDMIVIRNQYTSHEETFNSINKQDEEIAGLLKDNKKQKENYLKIRSEQKEKVETLKKIQLQKDSMTTEIFELENLLIEKKGRKNKFDVLQSELKEIKDKKFEKEKAVEELRKKIKSVKVAKVKKNEEHENEMQQKKLQIEDLKLKIDEKKKKVNQVKELQEILKTLEEKEKSELNDRQKLQEEQMAELEKAEKHLKVLEEKFEISEREYEELCKSNNLPFVSFKELENSQIQEILLNFEQNIREKEVALAKSENKLENSRKNYEEELRSKKEKVEEAKTLYETEKHKFQEEKEILRDFHQKIIEARKKIEDQIQEKQANLKLKENAVCRRIELDNKIQELKTENALEKENITLVENLKKDGLEMNKDIEESLKNKEALKKEEDKFTNETREKLKEIENRTVKESKTHDNKMLVLEREIQQNAKLLAQKKREIKKRDSKEMRIERDLREKLSELQEEFTKLKNLNLEKKSEPKSENVSSMENKGENLKSILKSPKTKRAMITPLESKSPKKVQFDMESDESSLSQFPLTQKPRSP